MKCGPVSVSGTTVANRGSKRNGGWPSGESERYESVGTVIAPNSRPRREVRNHIRALDGRSLWPVAKADPRPRMPSRAVGRNQPDVAGDFEVERLRDHLLQLEFQEYDAALGILANNGDGRVCRIELAGREAVQKKTRHGFPSSSVPATGV